MGGEIREAAWLRYRMVSLRQAYKRVLCWCTRRHELEVGLAQTLEFSAFSPRHRHVIKYDQCPPITLRRYACCATSELLSPTHCEPPTHRTSIVQPHMRLMNKDAAPTPRPECMASVKCINGNVGNRHGRWRSTGFWRPGPSSERCGGSGNRGSRLAGGINTRLRAIWGLRAVDTIPHLPRHHLHQSTRGTRHSM